MVNSTALDSLLNSVISAVKSMSKEEIVYRLSNTKNSVFSDAIPCEDEIERFFSYLQARQFNYDIFSDMKSDKSMYDDVEDIDWNFDSRTYRYYCGEGSYEPFFNCNKSILTVAA